MWKQFFAGYMLRLLIAAFLFAVLMTAFSMWMWPAAEGAPTEQIYQGVPLDAHLLALDKQALELAYQDHVRLLFSVWLKDDISVVHRINTGLRRGREAYSQAAARIEEREKALEKK